LKKSLKSVGWVLLRLCEMSMHGLDGEM